MPTRSEPVNSCSNAMAEKAASFDVRAFSDGTFSTNVRRRPNSPITSTSWMFLSTDGSAITVALVCASPTPAKLKLAATFTFAGNSLHACAASPLNKTCGLRIASRSIPLRN